jgi:hypothetical protein
MLDGVPVPTSSDAGPFLVTSSRSVLWVEQAFGEGFLRVAVRKQKADDLYHDLILAIATEGARRKWGNVQPSTTAGVLAGLQHLHYYELPDVMLLYGSEFDISAAPDISRAPVDWLPPSWGVLVPDRSYVGTVYLLGEGHLGAVVHNPSRGVVVLRGSDEDSEVPSPMPQV